MTEKELTTKEFLKLNTFTGEKKKHFADKVVYKIDALKAVEMAKKEQKDMDLNEFQKELEQQVRHDMDKEFSRLKQVFSELRDYKILSRKDFEQIKAKFLEKKKRRVKKWRQKNGGDKMKVSEIIDELNQPEKALADVELEEKRINDLYTKLVNSLPFDKYENEFEELKTKLKALEFKLEKIEYFARGLSVADEIYKAKIK